MWDSSPRYGGDERVVKVEMPKTLSDLIEEAGPAADSALFAKMRNALSGNTGSSKKSKLESSDYGSMEPEQIDGLITEAETFMKQEEKHKSRVIKKA